MNTEISYMPVPKGKLKQFDEILKATGGRYLCNPWEVKDGYRVSFQIDRYDEFAKAWQRSLTDIKEINKSQTWRVILRRFLPFNFI